MLDKFEQIAAVFVVAQKVDAINDENQRLSYPLAPFQCHLLELVEGSFDVQKGCGISRTPNTKQATYITEKSSALA